MHIVSKAHPDTHVSIITDGASSRYVVENDASATSLLCNFDIYFFLFRRDLKGIGNNYGYDSGMDNFDIKFVATKFHGQGENQLIVVHIVAGGLVSDNALHVSALGKLSWAFHGYAHGARLGTCSSSERTLTGRWRSYKLGPILLTSFSSLRPSRLTSTTTIQRPP